MNYIINLNHDFVRKIGEKLGLKNFYIDKRQEGWFLIFNDPKKFEYYVMFCDFGVYSSLGEEFCKKATNLWNVEMYKKFGKKYLRDLKNFEGNKINFQRRTKFAILKQNIKKISREK